MINDKMMMKSKLFLGAVLGVVLAGCQKEEGGTGGVPVAAVVHAEISDAVATRASGTAWADKDEIGVSENRFGFTNVCYRRVNGKFEAVGSAIFFQDGEPTVFSAYYPYDEKGGTLSATTDGKAQKKQPDIDFLYATGATASTHNPEVNFTDGTKAGGKDCSFHHCMSQITLTFEAGDGVDFSTIQPGSYTLSGLVLEGGFDTATGIAKADEGAQAADLDMPIGSTLSSSVILFPQEAASIGLAVEFNGNVYNATLDIPEGVLAAGNNYTYTVTVRNKGLGIEAAVISDWNPESGGDVSAEL